LAWINNCCWLCWVSSTICVRIDSVSVVICPIRRLIESSKSRWVCFKFNTKVSNFSDVDKWCVDWNSLLNVDSTWAVSYVLVCFVVNSSLFISFWLCSIFVDPDRINCWNVDDN
jgi:hypothetical protein